MKVIFIKDVAGVARIDEIKTVADGFALNYLFPRRLAVPATPNKTKDLLQKKVSIQKKEDYLVSQGKIKAEALNNKQIIIVKPASSAGTLYASISPEILSQAIKEQLKIEVLPKQIFIPAHIKTVGQHQFTINFSNDIKATVNLIIRSK